MTRTAKPLDLPQAELCKLISLLDAGKNREVLKLIKPLTKKFAHSPLLHLILGSANQAIAKLDSAIENYRNALKLDSSLIPAYSNLGAALADKGDLKAAMACYERVAELDPYHADVHFNIGSLKLKMEDTDSAMASFNNALAVQPNHFDAKNSMGFIYKTKKDYLSAKECFERAIELNSDFFIAYKNLGDVFYNMGKYDSAITNYCHAIGLNPEFSEAYNALGNTYREKAEIENAITNYNLALEYNTSYVEALFNLASAFFIKNDYYNSIIYYNKVVELEPDNDTAYRQMGNAFRNLSVEEYAPALEEICQKLLDKKNFFGPIDMVYPVIKIMKINPNFKNLLTMSYKIGQEVIVQDFFKELVKFPLLEQIITICPVPDRDISVLLENTREALIMNLTKLEFDAKLLQFYSALSIQCFINEYIFDRSERAGNQIVELETRIDENLKEGKQPLEQEIFALASFKPLHTYSWIAEISAHESLNEILNLQVISFYQQKRIRESIPKLQKISNQVSLAVQSQYEENPYPRWIYTQLKDKPISLGAFIQLTNLRTFEHETLNCKSPNILIAGCGTGQHAIQVASLFRNSCILAVDISTNSLAYAKSKAEELGIKSIEFMQADILSLSELDQRFDIIECSGVLHHMESPMAGWERLKDLLKPGGLMKVGLYSTFARRHIRKLRDEIAKLQVGVDAESLRSFRQTIMKSSISHRAKLHSVMDLYSLSEFRDLLFHVKEHQFSIPQIKECLVNLDLSFCGFDNEIVIRKFKKKFECPNDLYDMDKWNALEKENTDLFANMYQFWCQKAI